MSIDKQRSHAQLEAGRRPRNYITRAGYERIRTRYDKLVDEERPQLLLMLRGNIHDNFAVEQAHRDLLVLEAQIKVLEPYVQNPVFIDDLDEPSETVAVGALVTIREQGSEDAETYTLVGEGESDLSIGYISWQSPLARSLLGRHVGDLVSYRLPNGDEVICEILSIERAFRQGAHRE